MIDNAFRDLITSHVSQYDVVLGQKCLAFGVGGHLHDILRVEHDVKGFLKQGYQAQLMDGIPLRHAVLSIIIVQVLGLYAKHLYKCTVVLL